MVAIIIALSLTLFLIYTLKKKTISNQIKYPPRTSCAQINSMFENDEEGYLKYATIDRGVTLNEQGVGIYYCYCRNKKLTEICDEY